MTPYSSTEPRIVITSKAADARARALHNAAVQVAVESRCIERATNFPGELNLSFSVKQPRRQEEPRSQRVTDPLNVACRRSVIFATALRTTVAIQRLSLAAVWEGQIGAKQGTVREEIHTYS